MCLEIAGVIIGGERLCKASSCEFCEFCRIGDSTWANSYCRYFSRGMHVMIRQGLFVVHLG